MTIQYKRCSASLDSKATSFTDRTIEGYASVWDVEDFAKDTVKRGAFAASLEAKAIEGRGPRIPLLWQHDPSQPIGMPIKMAEDDRGLFTKDRVVKGQFGDYVLECAKEGIADGLSIGYIPVTAEKNATGQDLIRVNLIEKSAVTFPCLDVARIDAVKAIHAARGPLLAGELTKSQFAALVEATNILKQIVDAADGESEETPDEPDDDEIEDSSDEVDEKALAAIESLRSKVAAFTSQIGG